MTCTVRRRAIRTRRDPLVSRWAAWFVLGKAIESRGRRWATFEIEP